MLLIMKRLARKAWLQALLVQPALARLSPILFVLLLLSSTTVFSRQTVAPSTSNRPLVLVAEVDAIIHPVSAEYMVQVIDRADAADADLVVFTLRTPGGLVESTRSITSRMISAKTPVVVFVAPSGARAASAGFLITIAADVAAMAPGTHIGAAHPVSGSGQQLDEAVSEKAASDVAAFARSLATQRNRNVEFAEQAVIESRAFTEDEAAEAISSLDGAELEGRQLRVNEAKPQAPRENRGGYGGNRY